MNFIVFHMFQTKLRCERHFAYLGHSVSLNSFEKLSFYAKKVPCAHPRKGRAQDTFISYQVQKERITEPRTHDLPLAGCAGHAQPWQLLLRADPYRPESAYR